MELTTSQGDHVTSAVDSSTKKGIWFPKQIHFFVKLSTAEMMWSPCDVVSSTIIFSFIGDVCICQIIFKATGITSAMVLPEPARRIPHLLISTAENGVSTHQTFLARAQEFDEYLELKGIQRPVVLLSDGHGSRLNHNVLFLLFKQIQLFVTPRHHRCYTIPWSVKQKYLPKIQKAWVCSVLGRKVQSSNGDNWRASQEEYTVKGNPRLHDYSKSEAQALKEKHINHSSKWFNESKKGSWHAERYRG